MLPRLDGHARLYLSPSEAYPSIRGCPSNPENTIFEAFNERIDIYHWVSWFPGGKLFDRFVGVAERFADQIFGILVAVAVVKSEKSVEFDPANLAVAVVADGSVVG